VLCPEDIKMDIRIPKLALVVLIGASGSGKSTFARKQFLPTEIISSDFCRALVSDDENSLEATSDAFEVLRFIASKRLAAGKLTVVDATNVQSTARAPLIALAREFHCFPVAIVLNLPPNICIGRNESRTDRKISNRAIVEQSTQMRRSIGRLRKEGFRYVFVLTSQAEADGVTITREPLWNDKSDLHGPFDIIGDVHGCYDELTKLLDTLGYTVSGNETASPFDGPVYSHPAGRTAVFLGDLADRGPQIVSALKLVRNMVVAGSALCVPGNHDARLLRKLRGKDVKVTFGLAESLAQIEKLPEDVRDSFRDKIGEFIDGLVSHYVLDDRRLAVAHAGIKAEMLGRGSAAVRNFCLYGETTGETDEFGLPERINWASAYRGRTLIVFGHTPVEQPDWLNGTINIDTGCVFGGKLSALRYPEREIVSVEALDTYAMPDRPFEMKEPSEPAGLTLQQQYDDVLDAQDVLGKKIINTELMRSVSIGEEKTAAALEVMSRFAANPKWLIYLPPTMSPPETSQIDGYLEYPIEAFDYFRSQGTAKVVCEQKHMGSRAVVIVCRDDEVAARRFGIRGEFPGIIYTRTGRRFFDSATLETAFLERIRLALDRSAFWEKFKTDWVCLDCELMPWSAKAQELLKSQYSAVGTAAGASLRESIIQMEKTVQRRDLEVGFTVKPESRTREFDLAGLLLKFRDRHELIERYVDAYRRYCWKVTTIDDFKLAPFHLLATEGQVHMDKNHEWHMDNLAAVCKSDEQILLATPHKTVDLSSSERAKDGARWWEEITSAGSEGMVVKPFDFISTGKRGLIQPALKCRGKEYLRIIYGPEYTMDENLARLRSRDLKIKRSLALREFALGVEGLQRFIRKEPLRKIHECVFGVLALESEPVDPRL
jgi:protein phosphatase